LQQLLNAIPTSNTLGTRQFAEPAAVPARGNLGQQVPSTFQNPWAGNFNTQPGGLSGQGRSQSQTISQGSGGLATQSSPNSWSNAPAGTWSQQVKSGGWGVGNSNNAGQGSGSNGNRQSLDTLTGGAGRYPSIQPQPIAVTGAASSLAQGIKKRGNSRSAAQSLAQAYTNGQADAAAQAIASAATDIHAGTAVPEALAVAETLAETTSFNPKAASGLLAKSAGFAVNKGQTNKFARTMAQAFGVAKQKKAVPAMTTAVADAIAQGGADARYAMGTAIAQAVAAGGDSQAAITEATANAFCAGGSIANSWASAYAVALSQDAKGCLVLNQAKALAQSACGSGAANSIARAEATSLVMGFCGLLDMVPGGGGMGWSGGSTGSSTAGPGAAADGSGLGWTGGRSATGGLAQRPVVYELGGR